MDFRYSTAADAPRTDCLVLPLPEGDAALRVIAALPPAVRSQVERARKDGDFTGKLGTTQLLLLGADDAAPAPRVLLVGTGLLRMWLAHTSSARETLPACRASDRLAPVGAQYTS